MIKAECWHWAQVLVGRGLFGSVLTTIRRNRVLNYNCFDPPYRADRDEPRPDRFIVRSQFTNLSRGAIGGAAAAMRPARGRPAPAPRGAAGAPAAAGRGRPPPPAPRTAAA